MATHSSVLAWRIPWTETPGGLWSIGSQRVGNNKQLSTHASLGDAQVTKWCQYFLLLKYKLPLIPERGHRLTICPWEQQVTSSFMVGNENHKESSLPGSLQPTCSLTGRSLTQVLVVTMLLKKMAGNEWAIMWHQIPNPHEVTQKKMDTEATVRI